MGNEEILKLPFGKLLDEFKDRSGMSQNQLGKIVGVSGSQLSQIRNGTYKDVDGTEQKVRDYIKLELEKLSSKVFVAPKLEFAYIKGARVRIDGVIAKNKIALLRGDSGTGKTTLLKEFDNRYTNSFMIQAYKGMKRSELIDEIYKGLGVVSKIKNLTDLIPRIKNRILILDEANKLSGGTLEWLRSLHDKSKIAMIWGGTYEDITEILSRQPELNRRCKKIYMENLTKNELKQLVESFELSDSDGKTTMLWNRFSGVMGLSVEVLSDMKDYVLNGAMPDNEEVLKAMIELME
jgi:DNA transposition AAA+ family ATPase